MKHLLVVISAIVAISCSQTGNKNLQPVQIRQNTGNTLITGWYHVVDSSSFRRQLDRDTIFYYIDPSPIVTAENVNYVQVIEDDYGRPGLGIMLNKDVVSIWEKATAEASVERKSLALIVNDKLMITAQVNGTIHNGASTLNRPDVYSKEDLGEIKKAIQQDSKPE